MKPFFLRAVPKRQVTESQGEAERTQQDPEMIGGTNITPRENNFINETAKPYDPTPYKKHTYCGTDEFVRAKLENRSQGIPQIKKSQSRLIMRKDMSAEDVIGTMPRSKYGGFRIRNDNELTRSRTQGKFYGQHNMYDPQHEEAPLQPERDLSNHDDNASMRSSKAMSYNSKMSRQRRDIRNSIQEALTKNRPKWVTKSFNNPETQFVNYVDQVGTKLPDKVHVNTCYPPNHFGKRNLRNNPVYREIGLDRLVGREDYGFTNLRDIYRSNGIFNKQFNFANDGNSTQDNKSQGMNRSGFKYTNTCCMVQGSNPMMNNPFQVNPSLTKPLHTRSQTNFNLKSRPALVDQTNDQGYA